MPGEPTNGRYIPEELRKCLTCVAGQNLCEPFKAETANRIIEDTCDGWQGLVVQQSREFSQGFLQVWLTNPERFDANHVICRQLFIASAGSESFGIEPLLLPLIDRFHQS